MRSPARALVSILLVGLLAAPAGAEPEPLDYVWKGRQRRGPEKSLWGGIARNRAELRRLWDRYDQKGRLPVIRFAKNVAVLAGTTGSSSCPAQLHDLRLNRERKRIQVRMYQENSETEACTDDIVWRTFTVAVAREDLKPPGVRRLRLRPRVIEDPD